MYADQHGSTQDPCWPTTIRNEGQPNAWGSHNVGSREGQLHNLSPTNKEVVTVIQIL